MAEFRKWSLHFDDGNNLVEGKRVLDPPGFAAGGGKELVRMYFTSATASANQVAFQDQLSSCRCLPAAAKQALVTWSFSGRGEKR